MDAEAIRKNVEYWSDRLREASGDWGGVEICAVTKTVDPARVNAVWDAGIRTIGENRVQELMGKLDALNPGFRVELIGRLQTNKVKYIIDVVSRVQSLDRDALAVEISRRAVARGKVMPVLVEVNIGGEAQKGGVQPGELEAFVRRCARLEGLRVEGLMAVMPNAEDPETVRPLFREMRGHYDRLRELQIANTDIHTLSMGMSHDCLVAAGEGATMVRLGRSLFGEWA